MKRIIQEQLPLVTQFLKEQQQQIQSRGGAVLGTRGCVSPQVVSFSMDRVNNLSGVDLLLCTIPATAAQPVILEARAIVVVIDNSGTSAILDLGTTEGGVEILNGVDIKVTAGTFYPAPEDAVPLVLVADTPIYASITRVGTAATTGQVAIILSLISLNVNQP